MQLLQIGQGDSFNHKKTLRNLRSLGKPQIAQNQTALEKLGCGKYYIDSNQNKTQYLKYHFFIFRLHRKQKCFQKL